MKIEYMDNPTLSDAMKRVRRFAPSAYICLLGLVWEWCTRFAYGATDGVKLYISPAGLEKLRRTSNPTGLVAFLLLHEALHAMLNHGIRLIKFPNPSLANEAADYVINSIIRTINAQARVNHGIDYDPFPFIENVLDDPELASDYSVEDLYHILDNQQKQPQPQPQPQPQSGDDQQQDGDDQQQQDGDDQQQDGDDQQQDSDDQQGGGGQQQQGGDDQQGAGGQQGGDGQQSDSEILGDDWVGTGSTDTEKPSVDPGETLEDVADKIDRRSENATLYAQMNSASGMDEGSAAGVDAIIDHRSRDDAGDWHEAVQDWMCNSVDQGWNSPFNAPIYTSTGLVCSGRGKPTMGSIAVVVDVSYSVPTDKVAEMLHEVQLFLDTKNPKSIHLASVSDKLKESWELLAGDNAPTELNWGGCTLLQPGFDWVHEVAPDCEGMIYMTDGYSSDLDHIEEPPFPMLWLDWSGEYAKYPFGDVVVVK